jgi:hypothetical protein
MVHPRLRSGKGAATVIEAFCSANVLMVQVAPGLPAFNIVGLPDKAVSEAKERVRAVRVISGRALPARRITINLAPADLPKRFADRAGTHGRNRGGAAPRAERFHCVGRACPRRLDPKD